MYQILKSFLMTTSSSQKQTIQRIGRVLKYRKHKRARVYDIIKGHLNEKLSKRKLK